MKKFVLLLLTAITVFTSASFAQPGTVCNPAFTFTINTGNNVQFTPASLNTSVLLEHVWYFGDGSGVDFPNPSHAYSNAGTYNVQHVVTYRSPNDSNLVVCRDTALQTLTIANNEPCNIHANFFVTRDSLYPNIVGFNNTSTGVTSGTAIHWDFGDGSSTSSIGEYSTTHTYQSSGTFTVCFSASRDSLCNDDTCMTILVPSTNACNLTAYFSSLTDTSNSNTIHFFNQSTPLDPTDSIQWNFGDGGFSGDVNPTHTYNQAGTYAICLLVKKYTAPGTAPCVREYCKTIIVHAQQQCNLHANFSFVRDSAQTNTVYFNNTSTGSNPNTLVRWSFGDGTISTDNNSSHTYQTSGAYTVCLHIGNDSLCASDTCRIVQVQVTSACNLTAYFAGITDSSNFSTIHFINYSTPLASTDSIQWNFGDGGFSSAVSPTHTYNQAGTYTVCLRVKKYTQPGTPPCVKEYCKTIIIQSQQQCNLHADFIFVRDSVQTNTIYFGNTSTGNTANTPVRWSFGDGTSSYDNNPSHTYQTSGVYTVCLHVGNDSLCASDTCKTVSVQVAGNCNLYSAFNSYADSISNLRMYFINASNAQPSQASAQWNYGDGSASNNWNGDHTTIPVLKIPV
jgi:PKD repeat protein